MLELFSSQINFEFVFIFYGTKEKFLIWIMFSGLLSPGFWVLTEGQIIEEALLAMSHQFTVITAEIPIVQAAVDSSVLKVLLIPSHLWGMRKCSKPGNSSLKIQPLWIYYASTLRFCLLLGELLGKQVFVLFCCSLDPGSSLSFPFWGRRGGLFLCKQVWFLPHQNFTSSTRQRTTQLGYLIFCLVS